MKNKRISVKTKILLISVIPSVIISAVMLIIGINFMKSGMEDEIIKGLLSSAYAYKDVGIDIMDREEGDSDIESDLKSKTGYDFTWFSGDTRKNSSLGKSVIGTKAADTVIDAVINKHETFTSKNTQVAGKAYFVAYVPVVDDSGSTVAMAFTGVSRESVQSQIMKSIIVMSVIGVLLLVVFVVIIVKSALGITSAVNVMNDSIEQLANGKFVRIDDQFNRNDEIGDVLRNTNKLIDKLNEIIGDVKSTTVTLEGSSDELNDTSLKLADMAESVSLAVGEIAKGATEQADSIQQATENVGNIDVAVSSVSNTADVLAQTANEMKNNSLQSEQTLMDLKDCFSVMADNIQEIISAISETSSEVDIVNEKVEMINSIASQTNLLALNASIEAARAGDAGRGFAVVASEIGNLATNSNETADQIKKEMHNLLSVTGTANERAEAVSEIVKEVTNHLSTTVDNIQSLMNNIDSTVGDVETIASDANACISSKDVVVDAMSSLSAISEENAASTQETSASMTELSSSVNSLSMAAAELKELADKLNADMEFFK